MAAAPQPPGQEGPAGPGDEPAGTDGGTDAGDQDENAGLPLWPLAGAGMLAAALLGAVLLRRHRKSAYRGRRRMVASRGGAPTESGVRAAATVDITRLDQSLRLLSAIPGDSGPPDVGAVWIADGDIHLILAGQDLPDPPAPFRPGQRGSWVLPADEDLPDAAASLAPLPALVTIGSQPGEHLLVDLERIGTLTIAGPPDRASDLLRYLVAELAHNPWSELVEVTVAGFPPDQAEQLAALNPDRIRVARSLPEAAEALGRRLAYTDGALDAHGLEDALHGRVRDTATDTWAPQLLLVDQPGPEHEELLAYLEATIARSGRRCAIAVVASGNRSGRRTVTITEDGQLSAAFLDESHALPAASLPAHLLGPLVELVQEANDPADHPIPPAEEEWAAGTDATGGTLIEAVPVAHNGNGNGALPPGPELDDPGLDEAVAAWWRGPVQPPRVAVLGPIEITAPGQSPTDRARVCRELVVFLAARGEQGASATEINGHLWPNTEVPATVRTSVIMSVRRWLGTNLDGEQWLSEATPDGRYRLRGGILVDWHLFRRLRTRGERRGLAGAEDLRAALRLVRGLPIPEAGEPIGSGTRVPYSWLPGSPFAHELIVAGVVDTAHQLVDLCLATGSARDLETARWAVRQAWLADPRRGDDHPWRDLMMIAHAEGRPDQVRVIVADLLRWRDAEHPDDLAPETRDLISSLLVGSESPGW